MKNLLILIFCLWLVGCESSKAQRERQEQEYPQFKVHRINLGYSVFRLENEEVICYYEYDGGMDCKFKGDK